MHIDENMQTPAETPKSDDALAQRTFEVRSALKELYSDLNSPLFADEFQFNGVADDAINYNTDYSQDFNLNETDAQEDSSHEKLLQLQQGLNTSFMSVFSLDDLKDSMNQSHEDGTLLNNELDEVHSIPKNEINDDINESYQDETRHDLNRSPRKYPDPNTTVITTANTPSINFTSGKGDDHEHHMDTFLASPFKLHVELESMRSVAEQLTLEAQSYQKEIELLRTSIHTLRLEKATLQQAHASLVEEKSCFENENKNITAKCVELEKIAMDATVECEVLSKRVVELESDLFHMSEERDEIFLLQEQFEKATKQKESCMQQDLDDLQEDLKRMEEKVHKLKNDKGALDAEMNVLNSANKNLKMEIEGLTNELEDERAENKKLHIQVQEYIDKCSRLEDTLITKERNELDLIQERTELHATTNELQKRISSLEESCCTFEEESGRLRNINQLLKTKLEDQEKEYGPKLKSLINVQQQVSTLSSQLESARIENVALSDAKSDLDMELHSLKEELTRVKKELASSNNRIQEISMAYDDSTKANLELREKVVRMNLELEAKSNLQQELDQITLSRNELQYKIDAFELQLKEANEEQLSSAASHASTPPSSGQLLLGAPHSSMSHTAGVQTPVGLMYSPSSSTAPGSTQSMDDRLDRIKIASERALRTLKNISNVQARHSQEMKNARISKLDETEAFVLDILNSCGKRQSIEK
jgi:DNA repair exonuclease SbcCD ATPase subunit